jgi:alpha-galactosidase
MMSNNSTTKDDMSPDAPVFHHLRAAGVSLILDLTDSIPSVLHWGPDLGELSDGDFEALRLTGETALLHNAPDVARRFPLLAGERNDWVGVPGFSGHRSGRATTPRPVLTGVSVTGRAGDGGVVELQFEDSVSELVVTQRLGLTADGLAEVSMSVRSTASGDAPLYDLASLVVQMPVPARATEILDFTGKWSRERSPQRTPVRDGLHGRELRRGKPGVDSPYVMAVGTPAFGAGHGEVWAMHVAWSGDQHWFVERLPEGAGSASAVLGGGELVRPGEIRLAAGETYESPRVFFAWSSVGLDGIADRFHALVRSRRRRLGAQPLVLNTWEAVYFDHELPRLLDLVDRAASIGVERIVLDDGWFRGRRNDRAGLGDWQIDDEVWPEGLDPFVERVRRHGIQFGLWFEPEMINLDSDLARSHPDWILGPEGGLGSTSRHQYVLDIAHPAAFDYLLTAMSGLIDRYSIDFIKWDHNRDLLEAVRRTSGEAPGVHSQTIALYALLDALRARFPDLEIESCASGGGRVDLGIVSRTDRVWASDCNDPLERQRIQRWSELLLPPELLGSHVGAERSHTTHRSSDLSFRLATALFASAGIEWDITQCSVAELDALRRWSALYREVRDLIAAGRRVHADLPDDETTLHGSVASDGSRALFAWVRLGTSSAGQSGRVRLPGLDPLCTYRVTVRDEIGLPALHQGGGPAWFTEACEGGIALPGMILTETGVPLPTLDPAQALVLDVVRLDPA